MVQVAHLRIIHLIGIAEQRAILILQVPWILPKLHGHILLIYISKEWSIILAGHSLILVSMRIFLSGVVRVLLPLMA